ncbi:MAG: DUF58 domain-containing protein [Marinicellaceae bacterium]
MKQESHKNNIKKMSVMDKFLNKFAPNLMLHKKSETLPLLIKWRRVFIFPTKPGLFFGLVTFIMLIASLNFNNNMGLMMTFLLLGLAQVAMHRVFFNVKDLIVHHVTCQPVFLGQKAEFKVYLKSKQTKYDMCIKNETGENCLVELPAEKQKPVSVYLQTTKRGWQTCGKVRIASSYPFGLLFAWIYTKLEAKCLVYPMPESSPPPLPTHAQSEGKTNVIFDGEEFHGLKPFQPGDSIRMIAWKRTAQTGELISREFQNTQGEKLLLDFSQLSIQDTEMKLSRLTAWVLMAYKQQIDYCLKLPEYNSGFGYSSQHHLSCLKALAVFGLEEK